MMEIQPEQELAKIGKGDELHISSRRPDGT
jgi:hypothetical protein